LNGTKGHGDELHVGFKMSDFIYTS